MFKKSCVSRIVLSTGLILSGIIAGCLRVPQLDPDVVLCYQKKMVSRSPIPRVGHDREIGFLQPAKGITGPELQVDTVVDQDKGDAPVKVIKLSLDQAVIRALANNPTIQVISYDPAVSHEDVVQAAAQFDYIMFGSASLFSGDRQTTLVNEIGQSDERAAEVGLRKRTISGARVQASWAYNRTWDDVNSQVDYESTLNLQLSQPLLRDGWSTVNLAQLRVASISEEISQEEFRQQVEEIVADVYSTYWSLIQARTNVEIQERLLAKTLETYNRVLERHKAGLDATTVQTKQTESAVASRRAILVRSRKVIFDVQEKLGTLMGDAQINVLGEYDIIPTTQLVEARVHINPSDQLLAALKHSPILSQARLAIKAAGINVRVAENQLLPRLDLTAGAELQAKNRVPRQAGTDVWDGDYASYSIGIEFEYPLGNRERKAFLRQSRLKERQAVANLQNLADQVAQVINERVREFDIAYEELIQQRVAVEAAKVQLQALEDTEEIRGRLTPEFLNVKLQAQETLAVAESDEIAALVKYNTAITDLHRVTGTILDLPKVKVALPDAECKNPWPAWVAKPNQPVQANVK